MKALKITYWVITSIIAFMMCYSAYAYLTAPALKQGFEHLGYPDHLRVELAIAKLIGAALLVLPVSARIKEWAYAGFTFDFVAAFVAHSATGDTSHLAGPVVFFLLLLASYITYHRLQKPVAQTA